MSEEDIKEEKVGNGGEETTMEAGVIAPEGGVGINGENGGEDL